MLTGEHGVAAFFQAGRPGQVEQQRQRLAGHAVLAVVDVQVADGQRQLAAALRVVGKQLAQRGRLDRGMVRGERLPGWGGRDVGSGSVISHASNPSVT